MSTNLTQHKNEAPEQVQHNTIIKPRVDIYENEKELLLLANMPGVAKADLTIEINQETLTFEGKRNPADPDSPAKDFWVAHFRRSFGLSQPVDLDNVRAELQEGVLTLHLPKSPELKTRQIAISAG